MCRFRSMCIGLTVAARSKHNWRLCARRLEIVGCQWVELVANEEEQGRKVGPDCTEGKDRMLWQWMAYLLIESEPGRKKY